MKRKIYSLALIVILLIIFSLVNVYQAYHILTFQKQITGRASSGVVGLTILAPENRWDQILAPEGVFEPLASLSGTHFETFSIKFINLTMSASDELSCDIARADGSIMELSATGISVSDKDYTLNYTILSDDPIINDANAGYLPWVLKECKLSNSTTQVYNETIVSRIYVHDAVYWQDDEITRAVTCEGTPGVYFNNTRKCKFSEDTMFALQMRNGNPVNELCFNNPGVACSDNYCKGIFFPSCDSIDYFYGYSAISDDPNNFANITVSFASYNTPVYYTFATNSSGTFKLRIRQALSDKPFSFTIYNLTDVDSSKTNIYGSELGSGTLAVTNQGNGSYSAAYYNFADFTGTLDFTFNISFTNPAIDSNRTSRIVIAYGTDTNQGTPDYFEVNFNSTEGLNNDNEAQSTALTTDTGGVCGDEANNDFDYLGTFVGGDIWDWSYDCFDLDCNNSQGDDSQTNEFGSGKTGLCSYAVESNCTDEFDNDYDYIISPTLDYTDCHDADCFHKDVACPVAELVCNDSINNDWDYTLGENNLSGNMRIENNGTKYTSGYTSDLMDCEDIDCNGQVGGSSGELCNWGYETNCTDGFNNDFLQMSDCNLASVGSSSTLVTPIYGEYDCANYCKANVASNEFGNCDDNIDNDWDAITITGYYDNNYLSNSSGGIDCRWGGYFEIGSDYNPDEECNTTALTGGYICELGFELNCSDSYDNDFDSDANGMPRAGWSADTIGYLDYFGITFANDADYDDYDCQYDSLAPANESLNISWCFDSIDNDLDMYFFTSTWYPNSSTGYDCADYDCIGLTNPADSSQTCLAYEYNALDAFFDALPFPGYYCNDSYDNDGDGPSDCSDTDCYQQFDICTAGPCYSNEKLFWNSCADSLSNDYDIYSDCDDSDCAGMLGDTDGSLCKSNESDCDDEFDNDGDNQVDCDDSDCAEKIGGKINDVSVYCEASESNCTDGFDNDGDNSIDCYDSNCYNFCGLEGISGLTLTNLPSWAGQTSINSVSNAYILDYTRVIRKGQWYNITFKMDDASTDAQWTLGTATGGRFNKTAFDYSNAILSGPDAGSFNLSETDNGFVINSNGASLPAGYSVSFLIQSTAELSSSAYELTYAEASGSKTSLNNNIYHEVRESDAPSINLIKVIPENTGVNYGASVYLIANVSDSSDFGICDWKVYGTADFDPANSTQCKGSFIPTIEGVYYINATPYDFNSNPGEEYSTTYEVNIVPTGASITSNKVFYSPSDSLSINSTFNMAANDSLGTCEVIAKNSEGTETSLGTFSAAANSCNTTGVSLSGLSDDIYSVFVKVTETTDSDVAESESTGIFVCSQTTSGICMFADFDADNEADICLQNITNCADGAITTGCFCEGLLYSDGYCCSDVWKSTSCSAPAAPGAGGRGARIEEEIIEEYFSVSPGELRVDAFKRELKKVKLDVENLHTESLIFDTKADLDFIEFPEKLGLDASESGELTVWIYAPDKEGMYEGEITISGKGQEVVVPVYLSVAEGALFDIQTRVLTKSVAPGENATANITIINMGEVDRIVVLEYYIKKEGAIIITQEETIAIEAEQEIEITRNLAVPKDAQTGDYDFYADIRYDDVTVSSSDTFEVMPPLRPTLLLIAAIIALIIAIIILIYYLVDKLIKKLKMQKTGLQKSQGVYIKMSLKERIISLFRK